MEYMKTASNQRLTLPVEDILEIEPYGNLITVEIRIHDCVQGICIFHINLRCSI